MSKNQTDDEKKNENKDEILKKLEEIENKTETVKLELFRQFGSLENKIENIKKESIERFKGLEERINTNQVESEKKSFLSLEDQVFLTVIIPFLVLFVTLPVNDMASFLQSVFRIKSSLALTNAEYVKYFGIVIFLASSLSRYCALFSNLIVSKKLRYISFEALWLGLNVIMLIVVINLAAFLSPAIGLLGISITLGVLTAIFFGMLLLENYILKAYAEKDLVSKRNFPFASVMPLSLMFGLCMAMIVEVVLLASGGPFSTYTFYLVALLAAIGVYLLSRRTFASKKKSLQPVGKS
jgi:hypothetical protein